jgi:hypothetical protein
LSHRLENVHQQIEADDERGVKDGDADGEVHVPIDRRADEELAEPWQLKHRLP